MTHAIRKRGCLAVAALLVCAGIATQATPAFAKEESGCEAIETYLINEDESSSPYGLFEDIAPRESDNFSLEDIHTLQPAVPGVGSLNKPGNTFPLAGEYGKIVLEPGTSVNWGGVSPKTFTAEIPHQPGKTQVYNVTDTLLYVVGTSVGGTYSDGNNSEYVSASSEYLSLGGSIKGLKETPPDTPVCVYYWLTLLGEAADGSSSTVNKVVGFQVTVAENLPLTYVGAIAYNPNGGALNDPSLTSYEWRNSWNETFQKSDLSQVQKVTAPEPPDSMDFAVIDTLPVRDGYKFLFWKSPFVDDGDSTLMLRGAGSMPDASEAPIKSGRYESTLKLIDDKDLYPVSDVETNACYEPAIYLTAVWDKEFSLRYDSAGGAPNPQSEEGTFGIHEDTSPNTEAKKFSAADAPEREGYAFKAWSGSNGKSYAPGNEVQIPYDDPHLVLTAQWEKTPDPTEPGGGDNPGGGDPENPDNPGGGTDPTDPHNPGTDPENPEKPSNPDNPGGGNNPGGEHGNNPGNPHGNGDKPGTKNDGGHGSTKSASDKSKTPAKQAGGTSILQTNDASFVFAGAAALIGSVGLAAIILAVLRMRKHRN